MPETTTISCFLLGLYSRDYQTLVESAVLHLAYLTITLVPHFTLGGGEDIINEVSLFP